ncbi:hypothetical protein V3Q77_08305 [Flavobacterium davisii]|uniref:Phage terminase large subunit N-terminal domain-containing protein n=1 Tax=Flavobacterium davisii TaxID=2906077 RepID=A0ABW8PS71_9FLAO
MERKKKVVNLHLGQLAFDLAPQPIKVLEAGRGWGKSTILGKKIRDFVVNLPRATIALVGSTYSQILSRTLPSTIEGLEMFGIYQDIDFVVGRCGKKYGYKMPFQPPSGPMGWGNIIHFSNGTIFQLVSLDNPNSGRGLNSYGIIADEAALLDKTRLYNNVQTTNRAQKAEFKGNLMLGAEIYVSSTPLTKKGKWFVDLEDYAKANPKECIFFKGSALNNPYLRKEWFEKVRLNSPSELIYNAEILNIRPKEITDGFYANINASVHYYEAYKNSFLEGIDISVSTKHSFNSLQDDDVIPNEPLIVSIDFGVFNSCVVSQVVGNEYRVLKSMWVKSPKLLDDLFIEQFIPYYRPHQDKTVLLYGGHDGNNRLPNSSLTLFEQVRELLTSHGWTVIIMTRGAAATHFDKYLLVNAMLKENDNRLPKIRINEANNTDLVIALERTEALESLSGVEKNKKDERNKEFPQQHATHLTDAFDIPIVTMYNDMFKGFNQFAGEFQIRIS